MGSVETWREKREKGKKKEATTKDEGFPQLGEPAGRRLPREPTKKLKYDAEEEKKVRFFCKF